MYEMGRCQESGETCPFCRGTDRGMKKDRIPFGHTKRRKKADSVHQPKIGSNIPEDYHGQSNVYTKYLFVAFLEAIKKRMEKG